MGAAKNFQFPSDPIGRTLVVAKFAKQTLIDPMTKPHDTDPYNNIRSKAAVPYDQIPTDVRNKIENQLRSFHKQVAPSLVEKLAASIALDDWDRVDSLVASATPAARGLNQP